MNRDDVFFDITDTPEPAEKACKNVQKIKSGMVKTKSVTLAPVQERVRSYNQYIGSILKKKQDEYTTTALSDLKESIKTVVFGKMNKNLSEPPTKND